MSTTEQLSSSPILTMPHTPLVQIDPNSRRKKELSPYLQGQIIRKFNSGFSKH
jgi:hypothetical protein